MVVSNDFTFKSVKNEVQNLTVRGIFLSQDNRFIGPSGFTLDIVKCGNINAVSRIKLGIDKLDRSSIRV